jgi:hypothetical protein
MKTDTMESRLLKLLGRKWVTPLDALREVGCLSLAQRVSEWRRIDKLDIEDKWVEQGNKRFKAYKLAPSFRL